MSDEMLFVIEAAKSFGLAVVVAFASTPLVKQFARTVGAIDVPLDERRMHKTPVARLGGLAIFFGFLVSVLLFCELNTELQGMLFGAVIIVVLGCVDDVLRLPAWIKLVVQIAAALVPVLMSESFRITTLSNPLPFIGGPYIHLGIFSVPVSVVWIVAITNAVNFIDGLDGLALGVSVISSVCLLLLTVITGEPNLALIMAALVGGCIGFLPYNMNPAKMFMGDTGATFLGFIMATVSIQGLFKSYALISFAVPFLILGLPIFDIVVSVFRRLSKGQSPGTADRSHIHHRLIDMGFSQKQAVSILYVISAILGLSAVILTTSGEIKTIVFLLAVIVAVLVGSRIFSIRSRDGERRPASGPAPQADAEDAAAGGDGREETPPQEDRGEEHPDE